LPVPPVRVEAQERRRSLRGRTVRGRDEQRALQAEHGDAEGAADTDDIARQYSSIGTWFGSQNQVPVLPPMTKAVLAELHDPAAWLGLDDVETS
jgi:hypothetical protein